MLCVSSFYWSAGGARSCASKTKSLYTPWLIRICTGTGQYQNGSGISTGDSNFWKLYREMPRMQAWREQKQGKGWRKKSKLSGPSIILNPPKTIQDHPRPCFNMKFIWKTMIKWQVPRCHWLFILRSKASRISTLAFARGARRSNIKSPLGISSKASRMACFFMQTSEKKWWNTKGMNFIGKYQQNVWLWQTHPEH